MSSSESPLLPLLCAGERMCAWTEQGTGSWRGRAKRDVVQGNNTCCACLPITDPTTSPSSANCYSFAPLAFCLLLLSSGFLQPRENSFWVPVLDLVTTINVFKAIEKPCDLLKSMQSADQGALSPLEGKLIHCCRTLIQVHRGNRYMIRENKPDPVLPVE